MSARTHSAEYKAASRARKIAAGICTGCSRPAVEGYRKCAVCLGWPNGEKPQRSYPVRKKVKSPKCDHLWSLTKNGWRECLWCSARKSIQPGPANPAGAAAWKAVYAARRESIEP